MTDSNEQSITFWFDQLRQGNADAAAEMWERFFQRLVAYARGRMANTNRRVTDEEDIAAGVMAALCQCADRGKLPSIDGREDLWRLLLCWVQHDITDQVRADGRIKRGQGKIRGDSVFGLSGGGFELVCDDVPPADVLMEMDEQLELLLRQLPSENLRQIAMFRMQGHSNIDIAGMLDVSPRTVERKLKLIRTFWSA